MNRELIKIETSPGGKQVVSGRKLHEILDIKEKYTQWFNRMCEYGFVENQDFALVSQKTETNNPKNPWTEITDHIITIEMAKEISMIQRTEKGKIARQYFIECERQLLKPKSLEEMTLEVMMRLQMVIEEQRLEFTKQLSLKDNRINKAIQYYHEKKEDIAFVEGLKQNNTVKIDGIIVSRVLANLGVKTGRTTLYADLRKRGWITKGKRTHSTQYAIDHGYMVDDVSIGQNKQTGEYYNSPVPRFLVKGIIQICKYNNIKCTADDVITALEEIEKADIFKVTQRTVDRIKHKALKKINRSQEDKEFADKIDEELLWG